MFKLNLGNVVMNLSYSKLILLNIRDIKKFFAKYNSVKMNKKINIEV